MLNVVIILVGAVAFNALFPWRRYPAFLVRRTGAGRRPVTGYEAISHEDFVYALSQMDSFIDISEEDLLRIYSLATGRHREVLAAGGRGRQPFCAFLEAWRNPTLLVMLFGDETIEQQRVFG
jgi:hypothetical protein